MLEWGKGKKRLEEFIQDIERVFSGKTIKPIESSVISQGLGLQRQALAQLGELPPTGLRAQMMRDISSMIAGKLAQIQSEMIMKGLGTKARAVSALAGIEEEEKKAFLEFLSKYLGNVGQIATVLLEGL